jgi:pimeloyl-ACP methyl ester carboxylesterase
MAVAQSVFHPHRSWFSKFIVAIFVGVFVANVHESLAQGFRFGGPNGNGDPTDGRDPLDELVQPLADLNIRPGFVLSEDQKQKIESIRQAFAGRMTDWRKAHAADFTALAKAWGELRPGGPRGGGGGPGGGYAAFSAIRDRQQKLLATVPDPSDAQTKIEAVLSDDQREKYEAVTTDDGGETASGNPNRASFGSTTLPVPADGVPKSPGFYKLRITANVPNDDGTQGKRVTYILFLPQSYDPAKGPYPTLVFLHGSGETGTDGSGIFADERGPAASIRARSGSDFAKQFPMILVCPQCPPRGERWDQTPMLKAALQVLDDAESKVKIDPDRVYVSGLSMGGKGTWLLAAEAPDRFAALVPFSASTLNLPVARKMRYQSIWAIDGADDFDDAPDHNQQMVQAAQEAGSDAKVTILPNREHDVWDDYYSDLKFYNWFLAHHRLSPTERAERDKQSERLSATTKSTTTE